MKKIQKMQIKNKFYTNVQIVVEHLKEKPMQNMSQFVKEFFMEKDKKNEKKGFAKKAKWENQSDELRAIIQSKRANKGKL